MRISRSTRRPEAAARQALTESIIFSDERVPVWRATPNKIHHQTIMQFLCSPLPDFKHLQQS